MLAHSDYGTGLPLVFIHAFPLSGRMWEKNLPAFQRNFRTISIDLPGFGLSPLQNHTSTMEDMARDVIATLEYLKITDPIVLTGVSMGGYVLFQLLKLIPDYIRAMVLVSTRATADTDDVRSKRLKTIDAINEKGMGFLADRMLPNLFGHSSLTQRTPALEWVRSEILKTNPESVCAALRGMAARPDSSHLLESIKVPTLVLSGDEDTFTVPDEVKNLAAQIPTSRFESISAAGHLLTLEQPEKFNSTFLHFLKRSVL